MHNRNCIGWDQIYLPSQVTINTYNLINSNGFFTILHMLWCLSITITSHCLLKYLFADRSTSAVVMCACSYMRKSFWQKFHISIYMGLFLTLSFLKVLFKWVLVYYFLALQCLLLFYWFLNLLFWNVNLIYFLWGDPSCVLAYLGYALFWKIHLCTYVYTFAFLTYCDPLLKPLFYLAVPNFLPF